MDTGGAKEQTIKEMAEQQKEMLYQLVLNINNLVERNPKPEETGKDIAQRPDNVFDEIIDTLTSCRGLIMEATDKVQMGISHKVQ